MSRQFRQALIGLLALPLSALPFLAYGMFTPEGRLLRDRLVVAVSPPKLPDLTPAQEQAAAAAPRYSGKVMALVYHGVGSGSDAEGGFVVSPARFGEHLAMLRAAGMATVTAADVARAFNGAAPLPDNAVMISFDDGRADAMMFADPLLDQAGMRATMFVISGATDKPNLYYAHWDRIEKAARSGRWDIEAHTHDSHHEQEVDGGTKLPALTSLEPGESLDAYRSRVQEDLDHNDAAIEDHVGHAPVAFAYPFGAYGGDRTNDPRIRDILREEVAKRYAVAFQQDEQESIPLLDPGQDRTTLRRLEVGDWSGTDLLARLGSAAGSGSTAGAVSERSPDLTLTAPANGTGRDGDGAVAAAPRSQPGRPSRLRPAAPADTTSTTGQSGRAPGPPVTTTTSEPSTTTSTGPATTSTEPPSTSTTTQPPSTTTTTGAPPTTTTTQPSATTTTRPSGTTTEKPCRGKDGKGCRR